MVTKSSTNGGQQQYNQQQQQTQLYAAGGHPRGGGPPPPPATNQGVPGSNPGTGGAPNPNQLTLNQLQDMAMRQQHQIGKSQFLFKFLPLGGNQLLVS